MGNDIKPKISVVIPIYNVSKYIKQCLDGVVGQTLKEIEIICINDKTPDNSFEIVKEYAKKDSRIICFENEKNMGLGLTRNVGISKTSGEYISFIDSDDYIDKDFLSELYTTAKKYNSDIVCTTNIIDTNNGKFIYRWHYYKMSIKKWKKNNPKHYEEGKSDITIKSKNYGEYYSMHDTAWNKIYRRDFLVKNNLTFFDKFHEDTDFYYFYLVCKPSTAYNHRAIYYYRQDNASSITASSKNEIRRIYGNIDTIKNVIEYYSINDKDSIDEFLKKAMYNLLFTFNQIHEKKEVYEYVHNLLKSFELEEKIFIDKEIYEEYTLIKSISEYSYYAIIKKNIEDVKYLKAHKSWIELFGIYNDNVRIRIVFFGIKIVLRLGEDGIEKLANRIPIKKLREAFKKKFL